MMPHLFHRNEGSPELASDLPGTAESSAEQRESRLRSIFKAITYRIIGTFTTAAVALVVTGEASLALAIGAVEPFAKIIIYYLHERAWQLLPRGYVRRFIHRGKTA